VGLELPGWLTEPLSWIGLIWPQADEVKLFEAGQAWIGFSTRMVGVASDANRVAGDVWSKNEGDSVDAFRDWWDKPDGPKLRLAEDIIAAGVIGAALVIFAAATLALKIAFIVQLIILAVEVAQAIATAFATFGATTAEVPGFIAATRVICRQLIKQVVKHVTTVIKNILKKAKNLLKKVKTRIAKNAERRAARKLERKLADDLRRTNPKFDPKNPTYSQNCTHCVQAFELRRRGLNVQASGLPAGLRGGRPPSFIEKAWGRTFSNASGVADIEKAFSAEGSRGAVGLLWKNGKGGHVFSVENIGGKVRFLDSQNNVVDVGSYLARGKDIKFMRWDDLPTPKDVTGFTS
jgi:Skp family chaperone for outer membrane proteins